MAKKQYRVRNWVKYNESLVQRGSITFWFDEKVIREWHKLKQVPRRGRPRLYSDTAIECALTLRALFKLPLRATEGLIKSILVWAQLPLLAPDYT